jgi:hypothetical protein
MSRGPFPVEEVAAWELEEGDRIWGGGWLQVERVEVAGSAVTTTAWELREGGAVHEWRLPADARIIRVPVSREEEQAASTIADDELHARGKLTAAELEALEWELVPV